MAFKVNDNAGDMEGGADDAFNLVITNNSVAANPSGVFREHEASSTDSSATVTFDSNQIDNQTVKLSDNMQISISGCTVGDTVTFRAVRTNTSGNLSDVTDLLLAVYDSDGASTPAYDSSGNLKSGATESAQITSTQTTRVLSSFSVSASGLKRYRARFKAVGDGNFGSTGPGQEDADIALQVKVENSSGTTINNQTLYTWTVQVDPFI
tara:strand:- start:45 stop:671 length:627 start_codon:yes stop_codon:yes gene_type:complete